MTKADRFEPVFVEGIPRDLEPGKLYVSITYVTVTHLCACGCGSEVVTPLHPARWSLTYDGETVSLSPSVGSWHLPCRSHYVIRKNQVRWAPTWSDEQVSAGRRRDQAAVQQHDVRSVGADSSRDASETPPKSGFLVKLFRLGRSSSDAG